ncbi:MAG: maleylpyruvate isomerase N-terminal domain-containing protein, partial [Actinomycetota bacterium]
MATPPALPADEILPLFREGVDALEDRGAALDEEGWQQLACGTWTAAEVARHVAAVAGWYHDWLDRSLTGDSSPPFGATDLGHRNHAAVHAAADEPPSAAMARFVDAARSYPDRVAAHWDLPYGYPFGVVTAGHHAAAAAAEWHLHAWDLARVGGERHEPSDPGLLFRAVGACVVTARGGLGGSLQGGLVSLGSRLRP